MKKRILVLGSGGREHALGWKLESSGHKVWYAPGNGGTQNRVNVSSNDISALDDFLRKEKIHLTLVGPEQPLVDGVVDDLTSLGHRVFGPSKSASRLESDKFFSYGVMDKLFIPQAESTCCIGKNDALNAIDSMKEEGVVLKARGLAAGKGVVVCDSKDEAAQSLDELIQNYGDDIVVAERLYGEEFSVFGFSDGNHVIPLPIAFQDHKRLGDGDRGPNTGGMGAYGPVPIASSRTVHTVARDIMTPVVQHLKNEGCEYKGFLYAGMMNTPHGLKVIEFNVRFGDPECQPAMMLLRGDLHTLCDRSLRGKLKNNHLQLRQGAAACVVLASKGYPLSYETGKMVYGIFNAENVDGVKVFHGGTVHGKQGIETNGGRVLGVTAYHKNGLRPALVHAYRAIDRLNVTVWGQYRRDIGVKGLS